MSLGIAITDIYSIDEVKMEYVIDLHVEQTWNDERLTFNGTDLSSVVLSADIAKKIWLPDTHVVNSRETKTHVSTNTEQISLVSISSNGSVYYGSR